MMQGDADARTIRYGVAEIDQIGLWLAEYLRPGQAIGLNGSLGVGKTSLVRAILFGLGYSGEVPSPSYALVQPYDPPALRYPVLHIDLYRVEHPDEIAELGLDDAVRDALLLIEWPDRLPKMQGQNKQGGIATAQLPHIHLDFDGADRRILTLDRHEFWNALYAD